MKIFHHLKAVIPSAYLLKTIVIFRKTLVNWIIFVVDRNQKCLAWAIHLLSLSFVELNSGLKIPEVTGKGQNAYSVEGKERRESRHANINPQILENSLDLRNVVTGTSDIPSQSYISIKTETSKVETKELGNGNIFLVQERRLSTFIFGYLYLALGRIAAGTDLHCKEKTKGCDTPISI